LDGSPDPLGHVLPQRPIRLSGDRHTDEMKFILWLIGLAILFGAIGIFGWAIWYAVSSH
jgi:hypothetical protein